MIKKKFKFALYCVASLVTLFLPFRNSLHFDNYFKKIASQPKKTGITTLHYYDVDRNRPVITEVWYPVDPDSPSKTPTGFWIRCDEARDAPLSNKEKKYPLIMMSHGSGGDRYNISWLAEFLCANGYIVAATDHFGNTWNNKIPEYYARPWERPRDISFALDQLLENSPFKDRIDSEKIGFVGHSLGGATGIWIAGAQAPALDSSHVQTHAAKDLAGIVPTELLEKIDFSQATGSYRDERISAIMVMAPALGWMFTESSLKGIDIPVLIIAPEKDEVVSTENNAKIFASKISKSKLKILPGEATHYVFLNRANAIGKRFLESRYCEDPKSIDRKKLQDEIAENSTVFFNEKLRR